MKRETDSYFSITRDGEVIYDPSSNIDKISKYGTSEGAIRGWDTRGRGEKKGDGTFDGSSIKGWLEAEVKMHQSMGKSMKNMGYKYDSPQAFLLEKGIQYKSQPLTDDEKAIVDEAFKNFGKDYKFKECYYNAQLTAIYDGSDKLQYVEGRATGGILPVDHAWLEINGKVVDPTWTEGMVKGGKPILGTFPDKTDYLGVIIPKSIIKDSLFKTEMARAMITYEDDYKLLKDDSWLGKISSNNFVKIDKELEELLSRIEISDVQNPLEVDEFFNKKGR